MTDQLQQWREAVAALPVKSCGRLDMHTYLPDPVTVGRVTSDRVRYVYFEDGSECVVLGDYADHVAFRAADWGKATPAAAEPEPARDGVAQIAAERAKQRAKWGDAHDDEHAGGELVQAAGILLGRYLMAGMVIGGVVRHTDPWGLTEKHRDPIDRLRIVGALIAAEIDRLDRAALGRSS